MTDQGRESLFIRTARGAGWLVAWRVATRIIGLASTLILVRLLAPSDFGLIALATGFVLIVDAFAFIGTEDSLVREKEPSDVLLNTAFTLNVLRACISALAIAALAEPSAVFFDEPRLTTIILLLAAATALGGFSNVGTVAFRRTLAFEKEFRLQILPRLAGVVLTVILAVTLHNHWALIGGILLQRTLRIAMSYAMHPYRPRFSLAAWRDLASFSAWSWAIMLGIQLRERSESLLIGRMLDTGHVGIYETGKEIALLPTSELVDPVCHAAYSSFAEARNAGRHPGDACIRLIAMLALFSLPAGFGLSLIAAPLVRLAFGPSWLDAIPVVQAIGIAGAVAGFGTVCSTLLRAHALMRLSFRITIVAVPVRIALLLILIPIGGLPMAVVGISAAIIVGRFASMIVTFRHFGMRFMDLIPHVWRCVIAVSVMATVLWWSGLGWNGAAPDSTWDSAVHTMAAVALGATVYVTTLALLWVASGRPNGAEADALGIASRMLSRVTTRFRVT